MRYNKKNYFSKSIINNEFLNYYNRFVYYTKKINLNGDNDRK